MRLAPTALFQKPSSSGAEVLDSLIIENLQMQLAERVSIRFNDDEINRILGSMADNNKHDFR